MLKYHQIKIENDQCGFEFEGKPLFDRRFRSVLKFHSEGLAAVEDENGWFHLRLDGSSLYSRRFTRTFGYYFDRAAVNDAGNWFHIDTNGEVIYEEKFAWCGNFQESICTIRNLESAYFHINKSGKRLYFEQYAYAGDFKDGVACVRDFDDFWHHINQNGQFFHSKKYLDLGVFHKLFATARDENGWLHIDRSGQPIYKNRFKMVEPFYNGQALVEDFNQKKLIIDENGVVLVKIT
jgi:WG containing repeat